MTKFSYIFFRQIKASGVSTTDICLSFEREAMVPAMRVFSLTRSRLEPLWFSSTYSHFRSKQLFSERSIRLSFYLFGLGIVQLLFPRLTRCNERHSVVYMDGVHGHLQTGCKRRWRVECCGRG